MMPNDYKVRQELYHRLNAEHGDELSKVSVEITEDVIINAVRYFKEKDLGWIYPSKSYMVGICYARWLSEYFGGSPLEYLQDQTLLYNNDPYFQNYNLDPEAYDQILAEINYWNFDETQGMVADVKSYFIKEFMLDTNPL